MCTEKRNKEFLVGQNPELYQRHSSDPQADPFIVSTLSRCVAAGGSFLCDKPSMHGENINWTPTSFCNIYFGQNGTGGDFSQCSSVFPS